jgi:hypothetical protein
VELTYTLSNSPDPNAGAVGLNVQQAPGRYALSVILHLGSDSFHAAPCISWKSHRDGCRSEGNAETNTCKVEKNKSGRSKKSSKRAELSQALREPAPPNLSPSIGASPAENVSPQESLLS